VPGSEILCAGADAIADPITCLFDPGGYDGEGDRKPSAGIYGLWVVPTAALGHLHRQRS
jgi:hypothetical protein